MTMTMNKLETVSEKKRKITMITYCMIIIMSIGIMIMPAPQAKSNKLPREMMWSCIYGPTCAIYEALNLVPADIMQKYNVRKDPVSEYFLYTGGTNNNPYGSPTTTIPQGAGGPGHNAEMYTDPSHNTPASAALGKLFIILKGAGMAWALVIAVGHHIAAVEKGADPLESIFKVIIEFSVVALIIVNTATVCNFIVETFKTITTEISGGDDVARAMYLPRADSKDVLEPYLKALTGKKSGGMFWNLATMARLAIPYCFSLLLCLAGKFVIYQIVIEIGLRRIFAPLAISEIYQDGLRSPGMRYLKKLAAAMLKCLICVVVVVFVADIQMSMLHGIETGTGDGVSGYIVTCLLLGLTSIGTMMKCGELANDIVGA